MKQDVYMQAGQTLSLSGSVSYGSRKTVSSALVFPQPTAGSYATSNSNGSVGLPTTGASASFSSGSYSVPGGNYYLDSFSMTGGTLTFTGPVTIYMNGPLSITGGTITPYSNKPANFVIKVVKSTTINISSGTSMYCDLQGQGSTVNISGAPALYGRFLATQLTISGSTAIHVDTSLPAVSGASTVSGLSAAVQSVR